MDIKWNVTKSDIRKIQEFFSEYKDSDFVIKRIERNIRKRKRIPSRQTIWRVLVGCLLTTQQRSGPGSNVAFFLKEKPFLLGYAYIKNQKNVKSYCHKVLSDRGGIRRTKTISLQIAENFKKLELGLWNDLREQLKKLVKKSNPKKERDVAEIVAGNLDGLGPKQSRNFLQLLGLTRYEIPIDSRITKWLNNFGFPVKLSATALADPNYYQFVSEGIQALCSKSKIYPCVLDAAIFTSFDEQK